VDDALVGTKPDSRLKSNRLHCHRVQVIRERLGRLEFPENPFAGQLHEMRPIWRTDGDCPTSVRGLDPHFALALARQSQA